MPKTARTSAAIRKKHGDRRERPAHLSHLTGCCSGELDKMERISAVCEFFCQGLTVKEVLEAMEAKYGKAGKMTREEVYPLISYAASQGCFRYQAPYHLQYAQDLRERFTWLTRVDVVRTVVSRDVANHAAHVLLQLVKQHAHTKENDGAVHVGFAGGLSMRELAQAFAELLCRPSPDLPKTIVFHTMVAGFSPNDPSTDPNAFFTYFLDRTVIQITPEFVTFHAPAIVGRLDLDVYKRPREIDHAYKSAKKLDIIVTSGADWNDEHGLLFKAMQDSKRSIQTLKQQRCVGDMMCRPIGPNGPIEIETDIRAMTLMELSELPDFITRGKHVLLMLGSCANCGAPKGRLLSAILNLRWHHITHVVADSRTASGALNDPPDYA